ncbi:sensor histidine kinase [Streptomyces sp. NPDC059629]|uniref:sensor histidine kinase n=1 Tax=Streptomyces sp. NPDC059629 TaxID=3346889 RepID=UPI003698EC10
MPRDVPVRKSLLTRLLLLSALVSAVSITATAWLTVRTTAVAIRQEQGQALTDETRLYQLLLGYAATHHDWSGAGSMLRELAADTGQRITVTDTQRRVLVDSAGIGDSGARLPAKASADIDPLAVDTALAAQSQTVSEATVPTCDSAAGCQDAESAPAGTLQAVTVDPAAGFPYTSTIDPRAVGPFRLTDRERGHFTRAAELTADCMRKRMQENVRVDTSPSGRPVIRAGSGSAPDNVCYVGALDYPIPTEQRALQSLDALVNACLDRNGAPHVAVGLDFGWTQRVKHTVAGDALTKSCLDSGRREQLAPYVAPPALLFVRGPRGTATTFLDLSVGNRTRIVEVTGSVLLVSLVVTVLAGTQVVRPLRALASTARRITDGDLTARVKVTGRDEIARVAAAFNTMSEHRERSEELRKAMVNDVAHELRTPLSNIRGWLEAAEDGLAVPDQALLSSLLDEAVLLQHVIDDLRDLAAADAGELRLHPELIDVADLLSQVTTAHHSRAVGAGVRLLTEVETTAGDPLFATADPLRLRQAVGNLVSNAVRHTPRGGTVTLRARTSEAGGADRRGDTRTTGPGRSRTVIEVADTGSGISAEDLPLVFDRFWRADKSRNRQSGGSGLGLSIVRKLAEAHGGEVTAVSVPGRGSVFSISLPD